MSRTSHDAGGWRGAVLVAITYIHFLIFAQFAFLGRLSQMGIAAAHLKAVMAAMATGGILFSLLTPRVRWLPNAAARLRTGFACCAASAFLALLPLRFAGAIAVSLLVGAGLAILTVTLVTHLRAWSGDRHPLLVIGIGTGFGYLASNFPPLFTASAQTQSIVAGLLCIAALSIPLAPPSLLPAQPANRSPRTFAYIPILAFTALVWLDSAAFFIIQNTPYLKAGTWQGDSHLWINGLLHLAAAIFSAWILERYGARLVLSTAFLALGGACILLLSPSRIVLASALYPVGVSLYSVALVAYPSLLQRGSPEERGRLAGWLYAVAGWMGSAMGIGMGQNLGHVPPLFVAVAGTVILAPHLFMLLRRRHREVVLVAAVAFAAVFVTLLDYPAAPRQTSAVERGRRVYISEGCIHCHSQYVRPGTADVAMWGPVEPMSQVRLSQPPLIGNRRQGPDLAQVGARRSALWLKAHLIAPAEVSGASIMPSYAFLFHDRRGDDLVDYLASLHSGDLAGHTLQERSWAPSTDSLSAANAADGQLLYARFCATCHENAGPTRIAWHANFHHPPADLRVGPYLTLDPHAPPASQLLAIARIAKFGIPGTDMPGHEYLSDRQIGSIALWLSQQMEQPHPNSKTQN